jgi:peptidoglycan/xylan/chitin deacetylase (PgdA/CDA1 family)
MRPFAYYPPILGYHRVGPHRDDHVPTVTAEAFARQLQWLDSRRMRVVPIEALVAALEAGAPWPRRTVAITFDDGYEETWTVAWPILRRFGFPATVFITPAEVGLPGFMSWEQVGEAARSGMGIGSHTMHHAYLPLVTGPKLPEELAGSKREIEARIERRVDVISYPVGGFTAQVQQLARDAGYRAACTTNRAGANGKGVDRFALRRIKMTDRDVHPLLLAAKLSGYYDCFRQLKQPH